MTIKGRLVLATLALACGCGTPTEPGSPEATALGQRIATAAFEFRYAASDRVDVEWQEQYHAWATAALGVSVPRRIVYNKYLSRAHMGSLTGNGNTNAYADGDRYEIHTIWPRDNHEVVHLYSSAWGRPVALWSEGLAVAYQTDPVAGDLVPRWSRVPLDDHARQFLQQGRLIAIADLATTAGFRRFDSNVTYPQAGSFVRFVIARCGLEGVRRLFASGSVGDSESAVRTQFAAACGIGLDEVESSWRRMLDGGGIQDRP
jgi:hypothetical protein